MPGFSLSFLSLIILISITGFIGNVFLIMSISQARFSRMKSFEVFLLGLAVFNLEEILIVDIYDITMMGTTSGLNAWLCRTLKFLTMLGETASIFFTVLISIFRYQKLRDAQRRVSLPIFLDNVRSAWAVSGMCAFLAMILSAPTYTMDFHGHVHFPDNDTGCPPNFFQCYSDDCPFLNRLYKHVFINLSILLPLLIVSVTSCLIIKVLVFQKRIIAPALGACSSGQPARRRMGAKLRQSTVAILAALLVFVIDWVFYLILHLALSPSTFPLWYEVEFFMLSTYTTVIPYVYGIGNNLLYFRRILRK